MTARTPGAPSTASAASRMPSHTSMSRAFSRSGLFSVMVATGALISTCTLLVIDSLLTIELLDQRGQARVAHVGLVGLVEGRAVEEALVAVPDLFVELVIGRRHRVGVQH